MMGAVKNHGQSKSRALACEPDVSRGKGLDRLKVQGPFSQQRLEPRRDAVITFLTAFRLWRFKAFAATFSNPLNMGRLPSKNVSVFQDSDGMDMDKNIILDIKRQASVSGNLLLPASRSGNDRLHLSWQSNCQ